MVVPGQFNVTGTGAFTYTIPIVVPPGTAGMVPSLSLGYSSQTNADGLEGWGWTLSGLPSITRCPRTIAQDKDGGGNGIHGGVNYDLNDRFCLEGQRLMLVSTDKSYGDDGSEYRTEIDGFSKIVAYADSGTPTRNGPQYFMVWTKSGQIMEFGRTQYSRAPVGISYAWSCDNDATIECQQPEAGTVRSWGVNRISDTKGNYVDITYNVDTDNGQMTPSIIKYTGNSNTGFGTYNSVQFVYDKNGTDPRKFPVPTFQAGGLIQTTKRLTEIKTCTTIATGGNNCTAADQNLVSDYQLDYNVPTTATGVYTLKSVTLCDGSATPNCLVPTTFEWQGNYQGGGLSLASSDMSADLGAGAAKTSNLSPWEFNGDGLLDFNVLFSIDVPCASRQGKDSMRLGSGTGLNGSFQVPNPPWLASYGGFSNAYNCNGEPIFYPQYTYGSDLDGDGLTDVLEGDVQEAQDQGSTAHWYALRNDGTSTLNIAGGANNFGGAIYAGDFTGDGRTDFYSRRDNLVYFSKGLDSDGNWLHDSYTPDVGFSDDGSTTYYTGDFDGDGCTDLFDQLEGNNRHLSYQCHPVTSDIHIKDLIDDTYTLTLADFNGDGKTDILRTYHGHFAQMFYSVGTGFVLAQTFDASWNFTSHVATGDFNGDGKADIAVIDCETCSTGGTYTVKVFLSTGTIAASGTDWSPSAAYTSSATPKAVDVFLIAADFNNDGGPDLWVQFKPDGNSAIVGGHQYLFNFTPIAIKKVHNGLGVSPFFGATTQVIYDRINQNGSLYSKCGLGKTGYVCSPSDGYTYPTQAVDGPMYVVKEVDSSHAIAGNYVTNYSYAGGKMNLEGRGFQGFSSMLVSDPQTGIVQTTTYNTDFPETGTVAEQKKECPPSDATHCAVGAVLSDTINTYKALTLQSGAAKRYFVELSKTVATGADLDGSAMPTVTTWYTSDCDGDDIDLGQLNSCFGNTTKVYADTVNGDEHYTKITNSEYVNRTAGSDWLLGRLTTANVQSYIGNDGKTRSTSYCYDMPEFPDCQSGGAGDSGLLVKEIVEPDDSGPLKLETDYSYDAYGNKTEVDVTGCTYGPPNFDSCTSTTRTTHTAYDNNHQFPFRVTNSLGESESWGTAAAPGYDPRFGLPKLHTGPNGLDTQWSYDGFGRVIQELDPSYYVDGAGQTHQAHTQINTKYQYCDGFVDGGTDETCSDIVTNVVPKFTVTTTTLGTDASPSGGTQIAPQTRTYFDILSRVAYSEVQGFDRCWIRTITQHDAKGRIKQVSRPHFTGDGGAGCHSDSPIWTHNSYVIAGGSVEDALGRVREEDRPDGGNTQFVFKGLRLEVTEYLAGSGTSETTVTIKNAKGLVATVIDAATKTTDYTYDQFENLLTTTDAGANGGNIVQNFYDLRGRKTKTIDPDMGTWTYNYDAFGELYQQKDAKNQVSHLVYDALGRTVERDEPDMVSTWTYGNAGNQTTFPNSIDKLVVEQCAAGPNGNACNSTGINKTHFYDVSGRQSGLQVASGVTPINYFTQTTFDIISGKPVTVRGFSGFIAKNFYNAQGYLCKIADNATTDTDCSGGSLTFWKAKARDAELHALNDTAGNMNVLRNFDANSGRVQSLCASSDTDSCDVTNMGFGWDSNGNLLTRTNMLSSRTTEAFCYDELNRLHFYALGNSSTTCQAGQIQKSVNYNAIGNITFKSDVGQYNYPASGPGSVGPHALASIDSCDPASCFADVIQNGKYYYDANGNLLCVTSKPQCDSTAARNIVYTSFNMVASIAPGAGAATVTLTYGPDHQRFVQVSPEGTTQYFNDPASDVVSERFTPPPGIPGAAGAFTWRTYIMADGHLVAARFVTGASVTMKYYITDHLGSPVAIADLSGTTVQQLSYDPWGRNRNPLDGSDVMACNAFPPPGTTNGTRGFTGHEEMPSVCLINANARLYDETLGRFLAADPTNQEPYNPQDLNRYSYVHNNPLSLTDPSGYGGRGGFFKTPLFKELVGIAVAFLLDGVLLPELEAGLSVFSVGGLSGLSTAQLALNAGIAGGASGAIATGTLRGAAMGTLEAEAFFGVGQALGAPAPNTPFFSGHTLEVFVAHGAVGGLFSIGQKGGFGSGFLAAAIGSLADAPQADTGTLGNLATHAVAGGLGSMLGGGKFLNGAATGAFGYLFNGLAHAWAGVRATYALGDFLNERDGGGWIIDRGSFLDMLLDGRADLVNTRTLEVYELKTNRCLADAACFAAAAKQLAGYIEDSEGRLSAGAQFTLFRGQPQLYGYGTVMNVDLRFVYSPRGDSGLVGYDITDAEGHLYRILQNWRAPRSQGNGTGTAPFAAWEWAPP